MARPRAQQKPHCARPVGEGRGDRLQPHLRHLVHRHRQHMRRQSVAVPRQRIDQWRAVRLVVHEQHRGCAARLAIGGKQHAQAAHQRVRRRQGIGGRAGRTGGRALPAAGAHLGVDRHMVARGCNGAGRTEIEAAPAAHDARARMRAQILGEGDVARLVETADEIARLQHRAQHGLRVVGIGLQVAVAQVRGREQRRAAGQIEHDVAARDGAVARRPEHQRPARGRRRRGIVVDHELERAEMSLRCADGSLHDGKRGDARRHELLRPRNQHGDVEMILQQLRRLDGALVRAVDEGHAFAVQAHIGRFGHRLRGGGEQRRHFRPRLCGLGRPARGLPDIRERNRPLARDFREQRRFLRTGDRQRCVAGRSGAEAFELGPAELVRLFDVRAATAPLQRGRVERHGVFARTHQNGALFRHGCLRHGPGICWPPVARARRVAD